MASLYIHIPFCERKCLYCDFYSVEGTGQIEDFLALLMREISLREAEASLATFDSIFFGGGTPSLLEPDQVERILSRLHSVYRVSRDAEVTLEANPGTLTKEKLQAYRSLGMNRISIGIQSFHDRELSALGRIHDRAGTFQAIQCARDVGIDNVSLDLIFSIPGQSMTSWEDNLRTAVALAPQHLAAYSLIVEEGTPLACLVGVGAIRTNPVNFEAEMYQRTMEYLGANGYEHYEVSNYALPGFRCRHNCTYWSHENYLGFGPSAHSFWKKKDGRDGRRWWNAADLSTYRDRLRGGSLPTESGEDVGPRELLGERIFLGLRTGGLDLGRLRVDFGYDFVSRRGEQMRWMIQEDLALLEQEVLRLTPRGFLLCDEICSKLLP